MIVKCAPHLSQIFNPEMRDVAIHEATKVLSEIDFDVIVVTGTSGVPLGAIIAHVMRKKLAIVRRDGETMKTVSGMSRMVEGWLGGRFIFFDDLISSGQTRDRAVHAFQQASDDAGEVQDYVGYYTYDSNGWRSNPCPTYRVASSQQRTNFCLDPTKDYLSSGSGISTF